MSATSHPCSINSNPPSATTCDCCVMLAIDTEKRGLWAYYWATSDGRSALEAVKQLP